MNLQDGERDTKAAKAALILGYTGVGLLWIWRMIHPRSAKPSVGRAETWATRMAGKLEIWAQQAEKADEAPDSVERKAEGKPLQSLSLTTPGDAPLDRLARSAAAEAAGELSGSRIPPFDRKPSSWQSDSPAMLDVLAHQRFESPRLEGWHEPRPGKLPVPTFAPAIMAFGIVMFAMGLATTWYVCLIGSVIFAVAARRWAGELQEE